MTTKLSPIQLTDFQLLNLHYEFINPTGVEEVDTADLFSRYIVDVDFAISPQDNLTYAVFVKATVNKKAALPGYVLSAEGVSTFQFIDRSSLSEEVFNNLLVYSGVAMAAQQLRSRLADLTAIGPFGKYMLPTLDMNDLLAQKRRATEKATNNRKVQRKAARPKSDQK